MRTLWFVFAAFVICSVRASTWTDEKSVEWEYTIVDGNVRIDGASSYGNELIVPSSIFGMSVVEIQSNAFYNCKAIGSVIIPSSVRKIGACAFYGSSNYNSGWLGGYYGSIKSLVISNANSLVVGERAFYGQPVTTVDISGTNITISSCAFYQTYDRSGNNTRDWRGSVKLTGENITVGDFAFSGLMYRTVDVDLTGVSSIGENAFYELGLYYRTSSSSWYEAGGSTIKISAQLQHLARSAFERCNVNHIKFDKLDSLFLIDNWAALNPFSCYYFYLRDGENGIVRDLHIPQTVRSIPAYALNNVRLSTISIPAAVTNIGEYAFYRTHVTNVVIDASGDVPLCNVGEGAFESTDISSFEIPRNWKSLAPRLLSGTKLTSIRIPEGIESIGDFCFSGCSAMTNAIIPNSCREIGGYAFAGCKLPIIDIPDTVNILGKYCFSECTKLEGLKIPLQAKSIGDGAFYRCYKFTDIDVPSSVTNIGANAFAGINIKKVNTQSISDWCKISFKDATANPTSISKSLCLNNTPLVNVVIPDGVCQLHDYAFVNCTNIQSITIPASVGNIGKHVFDGCVALKTIIVASENEHYEVEDGVLYAKGDPIPLFMPSSTTRLIVREGCTIINSSTTKSSSALEYVYVPASVTNIDPRAFLNCRGKIEFGVSETSSMYKLIDGVIYSKDGTKAIVANSSLKSVMLPPSVKEICEYCFDSETSLTNIVLNDGLERIRDYAFQNCSALTSVVVPDTVISMGYLSFGGAIGIGSLTIPFVGDVRGVRTIPAYNKKLSYIFGSSTMPTNLKKLVITDETRFYEGCLSYANNDKLEELTLPFVGQREGAYWSSSAHFGYVFGAESYENNVSVVPASLKKVTITKDSVIGSYAFYGCSGINQIIVDGDTLKTIRNYAFKNCTGLKDFIVPDSTTYIGEGAFYGCSAISSITIPSKVNSIGYYAFVSCSGLTTVYVDKGDVDRIQDLMDGKGRVISQLEFIERDIPVRYEVMFNLGLKGVRISGGALVQSVAYNSAAIEPIVSATNGYEFVGWDKPTDKISANTTFNALYELENYSINYVNVKGNAHDNPATFTVEDSITFESTLPFTDGMEFVGWGPMSIQAGTYGDQTVSAIWRTVSLGEGAGATNISWESVGDVKWKVVKVGDKYVLQSGAIGDNAITKIVATVIGEGVLTFNWKASTEIYKSTLIDYGVVRVDDADMLPHVGGEQDWILRTINITGAGLHTISWEYIKDENAFGGQDCIWLADVNWIPKDPIPAIGSDASEAEVKAALNGSADGKLTENIKDGITYGQYREWANNVKAKGGTSAAGTDAVKNSSNAWLSFALGSEVLIETAPTDGDLKVDTFEPATESGKFDFTVSVKDVEIGSEAAADNLKKVFGLEGGTTLDTGGLSSANVDITFGTPVNGKVKFTAGPNAKNANAKTFFMKVKMTP